MLKIVEKVWQKQPELRANDEKASERASYKDRKRTSSRIISYLFIQLCGITKCHLGDDLL